MKMDSARVGERVVERVDAGAMPAAAANSARLVAQALRALRFENEST